MQKLVRAVMLVGMLAGGVASAWGHDPNLDHERALRALQAGEIVPLNEILQEVQRRYDGTVVELELTQEDGRWVYEVELLAADGHLLELWIDAKTRQLLREDGH